MFEYKSSNEISYTKRSFSFSITKGLAKIYAPVLDCTNNPLEGTYGLLQLYVNNGNLFVASYYNGDKDRGYICFVGEKSTLFHEGVVQPKENSVVQPLSSIDLKNCKKIIYESEPGMRINDEKSSAMFLIAVEIFNNLNQQIKTYKTAIEINGATLRHYSCHTPEIWLNQFIEFLKVKDFAINGYIQPAVVVELHINLSHCAIDYRPLKLPIRSALTIANLNMSCNITSNTPSFLFRFIAEEIRLFLSKSVTAKNINLRQNYVCVIDAELIDVCYRTNSDENDTPRKEICLMNNIIHVHTCADSFRALSDFLIYLSANGDLENPLSEEKVDASIGANTQELIAEAEQLSNRLTEAMKEAMQETTENNANNDQVKTHTCDIKNDTDDEFCILDHESEMSVPPVNDEPQVRILSSNYESFVVIENYFSIPPGKSDDLKAPKHFPIPIFQLKLRELSLTWQLYGGSDFKPSSSKSKKHVHFNKPEVNKRVQIYDEENSINIDSDNSSISYCNVSSIQNDNSTSTYFKMGRITLQRNKNRESWINRGGPHRNKNILMELKMSKIKFLREIYSPSNEVYASYYVLMIKNIEIIDRIKLSVMNKFLCQYISSDVPRQTHANMIDVEALYTNPNSNKKYEECSLKVSCKPLKLHIDQDALIFLIDFFQQILEISDEPLNDDSKSKRDGLNLNEINVCLTPKKNSNPYSETFYKSISFSPEVLIVIDYQSKRITLEQGTLQGILMGLTQLNNAKIVLKRLTNKRGLKGHHKVLQYALNEWYNDIITNQVGSLVAGVGPIQPVVQFFKGLLDLFCIPIEHYKKDGQIVRGLQRGAYSFSKSTAMALVDLSSSVFGAIQSAAELAYDMVSPGPSVSNVNQRDLIPYEITKQPADIREGVIDAFNVIKEGLGDTAKTILHAASSEHEHKGIPGAVGGVLRQIPPSACQPFILTSKATNLMLGGVRAHLMPDAHQQDINKWRTSPR